MARCYDVSVAVLVLRGVLRGVKRVCRCVVTGSVRFILGRVCWTRVVLRVGDGVRGLITGGVLVV